MPTTARQWSRRVAGVPTILCSGALPAAADLAVAASLAAFTDRALADALDGSPFPSILSRELGAPKYMAAGPRRREITGGTRIMMTATWKPSLDARAGEGFRGQSDDLHVGSGVIVRI